MSNNGWTPERRKRQAEMIRNWKPWEHSTGPKTPEGIEVSKMNAEKHGMRGRKWQLLKQALQDQSRHLEEVQDTISL